MSKKLSFCLKAVKTLDTEDLDQLTQMIEDYMAAGMPAEQAEEAAVNDILRAMAGMREELTSLLREQHSDIFSLLSNPTAQGLREQEAATKKAEAADKAEQKRLANKAKADAEVAEFTLTGSDRAADAPGQSGLPGMSIAPSQHLFSLSRLPRDMREELFNEHATNLNPEATEAEFYAKQVPTGLIDLAGLEVNSIPEEQLKRYMDADAAKLPPIVIADGRLIDGQHRINAARLKGIKRLRYIDVSGLIDTEAGGYISALPSVSAAPPTDSAAFKAWFADSKVVDAEGKPLVVYHGTGSTESIAEKGFDTDLQGVGNDAYGSGFYFTSREKTAKGYAAPRVDRKTGEQVADTSPGVFDVYLSIQKPLRVDARTNNVYDMWPPLTRAQAKALIEGVPNIRDPETSPLGNWAPMGSEASINAGLRKAIDAYVGQSPQTLDNDFYSGQAQAFLRNYGKLTGHDGAIVRVTDDETHYVAWFPTQIKSATSNAGTFDPANPDIRADFDVSGRDRIPVGETIEDGPVPDGNAESLATIQKAYSERVADFKNLVLTALPEVQKPHAGASQATKERYAAQELGKLLGVRVGYFAANMQRFAEGVAPLGNQKLVFINEATSRPVMALLGHELTHSMRESHPGLYKKLVERMRPILQNPEKHHTWLSTMYASRGIPALNDDKLLEELIADIVGDTFTNPQAMQELLREISQDQPGLFMRVLAFIRDFLNNVMAKLKNERPYGTGRYLNDVEAARDAVLAVMKEFAQRQQAAQQPRNEAGRFTAEPAMASVKGQQTDTPEFKAWFGDSKVVDAKGEPLVVYHGTAGDFDAFRKGMLGSSTRVSDARKGFFFVASGKAASEYTWKDGNMTGSVMPVYLAMENPLVVDLPGEWAAGKYDEALDRAKAAGHDGVVIRGATTLGTPGDLYVAFDPRQIKSAIGNSGAFDPANPSILASANAEPFYSELARQVEQAAMKSAPADGWLQWLKGLVGKGTVKADEIAWTGIEDWLKFKADDPKAAQMLRDAMGDSMTEAEKDAIPQLKTTPAKIPRDEVLGYLKANGVQVTETMLGGHGALADSLNRELEKAGFTADLDEDGHMVYFDQEGDAADYEELPHAARAIIDRHSKEETGEPKYGTYVLPGGQNYRELLLTLPSKPGPLDLEWQKNSDGMWAWFSNGKQVSGAFRHQSDKQNARPSINMTVATQKGGYSSPHWMETPNVLAHIRFNERTDADGKRVLFIEEIQSDWAQQGKKHGFKKPLDHEAIRAAAAKAKESDAALDAAMSLAGKYAGDIRYWGEKLSQLRADPRTVGHEIATAEESRRQAVEKNNAHAIEVTRLSDQLIADESALSAARRTDGGLPQAPFVTKTDAWVSLAVKRMIRYAAENNFDRVAFVNGEQSAERYDLSKQVDRLDYNLNGDGTFNLSAIKDGKEVFSKEDMPADELESTIGKELAQKMIDGEGKPSTELDEVDRWEPDDSPHNTKDFDYKKTAPRSLSGIDLKVGGEGMKAFYDKIVPKVVKDVIKKIGGDGLVPVDIGATKGENDLKFGMGAFNAADARIVERAPGVHQVWVKNENGVEQVRGGNFKTAAEAERYIDSMKPGTKQLGFDITPKMRDAAGAGLPMFSLAPNVTPPREGLARAFQRKFQDSFNRFTTIKNWAAKQGITMGKDADVWAYEERMHGRIASRVEDFREKRVRVAIKGIQKAGYSMEQVAEFLHAQHAEERNKQIESIDPATKDGSGMSTADARAILAKVNPKLVALANDFRKITDETRDMLLAAGIIDQDMVDAWQKAYSHYVPLKGGDEDKAAKSGTGKGLNVAGKQKRALGHGERSEHIIENIMRDHERAIALVEKNRVGHSLLSFITDLANPEVATIGKPEKRKVLVKGTNYEVKEQNGARIGIFDTLAAAKKFLAFSQSNGLLAQFGSPLTIEPVRADPSVAFMASPQLADNEVNVYVDGHAVRVQLNDELLARAYTRSGVERLNQLMAINREINNFLSKAYTGYNPEFFFTNVIRDFTTGMINVTGQFGGKVSARAVAGYPKAFASLIRYSVTGKETPEIKDYRAAGGSTGAAYLGDLERIGTDIQKSYDDYRGTVATFKGDGAIRAGRVAARKMAGSILQVMEHLNSAGESAMRLSVFEAVRTTPGYSDDDAASAAKNSTVNFNRRGELGPVMGAMYLFFNPAIQGTAAMMDAAVNGKHKNQARALLAALPALAYALSLQFAGGDEDDEFWKAIPESTKDKNLVIRTGKKTYITIPVPYGPGFLFSLGNSLRSMQLGEDVDKVSLNVASNLLEHFSPIGNPLGGDKAELRGLGELVPGAVGGEIMRNLVRVATNRSGLGGDIIPDSPFDRHLPDNLKMYRATKGSIYEKIARWANASTGGTAALPGAVDVSPETLKYWVRAITGGSGAFLSDSTTIATNAVRYVSNPNDPDKEALRPERNELPIVRRFVKEETIGDRRRLFWEAVKEVEKAEANLERARKLDDEVGMDRIEAQHGELLAMGDHTDAMKKAVKAQRDAVQEVMADTATSLAYKRARVKELEVEEASLYNEYVREYTLSRRAQREAQATEAATQ